MFRDRYLRGLEADPFEGAPGVFAVAHARRAGAYRYFSTYAAGRAHKRHIFDLLTAHTPATSPDRWVAREWDLHHVVEGQDFASIDFRGRLAAVYRDELPCVLLDKKEHHAYNSLLHSGPTDELYRDGALPAAMLARSQTVAAEYRTPARRPALRARVQALAELYRNAYAGDPVLQRVARNVFDEALALV
jgi:hypothetical protein